MGFHVFKSTVPLPDNKPRRGYYPRSILCNAVKQVMRGTMTVSQASYQYRIPRTTIQKHFSKAREQHNLKDLYIRRMEELERDLLDQVPGSVFQQQLSSYSTAFLLSYGVDVWPTGRNEASVPLHWRQQPVRITYSSRYVNRDKEAFFCESNMAIAGHCEIRCDDVQPSVGFHEEQKPSE